MSIAHVLCDEGICAERWLGALVHAGAHPKALHAPIEQSGLPVRLIIEHDRIREVTAIRVRLEADGDAGRIERLEDLHLVIDRAGLAPRALKRAHAVADAVGRAEAAVHDVPADAVRLHELGRPIAAARIVAGAAALEDLEVDRITVGPISVGNGQVRIAHGRFPVPPPAVLELLRGFEIEGGSLAGEVTSPSGAAVLAALADPVRTTPRMKLASYGRGAVHRDDQERLLTVLVGSPGT